MKIEIGSRVIVRLGGCIGDAKGIVVGVYDEGNGLEPGYLYKIKFEGESNHVFEIHETIVEVE